MPLLKLTLLIINLSENLYDGCFMKFLPLSTSCKRHAGKIPSLGEPNICGADDSLHDLQYVGTQLDAGSGRASNLAPTKAPPNQGRKLHNPVQGVIMWSINSTTLYRE